MKKLYLFLSAIVVCLSMIAPSHAALITGVVQCDANQNLTNDIGDVGIQGVVVIVTNLAGTFSNSTVTAANGSFSLAIPDFDPLLQVQNPLAQIYVETLDFSTLPSDCGVRFPPVAPTIQPPVPAFFIQFSQDLTNLVYLIGVTGFPAVPNGNWLLTCASCPSSSSACGLSGGGTIAKNPRPAHNFGGHVSPVSSMNGMIQGEWTHIAHNLKLQFHSTEIQTVTCGTVPGTSFEFIEFSGLGVLKGIAGKKAKFTPVLFVVRAEDHGQPGRNADRYYIRVYLPDGTTLLLVSGDPANPANIVTVPISSGNLNIQATSPQ